MPMIHRLAIVLCLGALLLGHSPASHAATPEVSPHLYVFISSGMPKGSLLAVAKDTATLDAPLLLRGMVGSSLQETLLNLKDLVAQGVGLEVDPLPFVTYGIEAVPAVVLTCGARNEGPYAVVYGLLPSQALPYLRKALPKC
jgi:conjugal transfer pilus assembly protein TrbC